MLRTFTITRRYEKIPKGTRRTGPGRFARSIISHTKLFFYAAVFTSELPARVIWHFLAANLIILVGSIRIPQITVFTPLAQLWALLISGNRGLFSSRGDSTDRGAGLLDFAGVVRCRNRSSTCPRRTSRLEFLLGAGRSLSFQYALPIVLLFLVWKTFGVFLAGFCDFQV